MTDLNIHTFESLTDILKYQSPHPITLTIGSFDAIHLGHQKLIQKTLDISQQRQTVPALLTFKTHPRKILNSEKSGASLFTLEHRIKIIRQYGIKEIFIINFTPEIAQLSPLDFVQKILCNSINCSGIIIGDDFQFGKNRKGNVAFLKEVLTPKNIYVEAIEQVLNHNIPISTTEIRQLLLEQKIEDANKLLGRPFTLLGKIQSGFGRGRTIGYPTINILPETEITPALGVYITKVEVNGITYPSITNVGYNPTFNDILKQIYVETHVFDKKFESKDETIELFFLKYIRPERKFENIEALKQQISSDVTEAKKYHNLIE